MKPIPAIVESVVAPAIAQVRSIYSELREVDAQVEKADKRFEEAERSRTKQREAQARLRLDLGRALSEVRKQWPKRGPNARGWGEFLEREGIDQATAWRYMELAGYAEISCTEESVNENSAPPTYADAGIDKRPRKESIEAGRFDPDDVADKPAPTTNDPARTSGRGKPQWLMQAIVRDYTREGDLVCDPLAGFGSTLLAAKATFRRAVGAEIDHAIALESAVGETRLGDWRIALADVDMVDAVITDPPYSERTHEAVKQFGERKDGCAVDGLGPTYEAWTRDHVFDFVRAWSDRTRGWMVALTDHHLIPDWQDAYEDVGRYAFAPVVCVIRAMSVRLRGDGPSSWAVYAMVARPRDLSKWGTLPGAYVGTRNREEAE